MLTLDLDLILSWIIVHVITTSPATITTLLGLAATVGVLTWGSAVVDVVLLAVWVSVWQLRRELVAMSTVEYRHIA